MAEVLEVRDSTGAKVALLSPQSDGLDNVIVTETLNGPVTLSFILPFQNEKWQYMREGFTVRAAGHNFLVVSTEEIKDQEGMLTSNVQLEEIWVELADMCLKYLEVEDSNKTATQLLTSLVNGSYGTTGLCPADRGWSVGNVTPTGNRDLEATNLNCLSLMNKVRELYNGYLVFDSIAKTVNLYATYGTAKAIQLRCDKNLRSLNRKTDYSQLVTRLIPLGKMEAWGYTDISSVNGGSKYLEDFSYSTRVIERVWENPDIDDPQALKDEAAKRLAEWRNPTVNYTVDLLDLRNISGYGVDTFSLGDTLTLIDLDLNINVQVQVVKRSWNIYEPEQGSIELCTVKQYLEDVISRQVDYAINEATAQTFIYTAKVETKSAVVTDTGANYDHVKLTFSGKIKAIYGMWAKHGKIHVGWRNDDPGGGVGGPGYDFIWLTAVHVLSGTGWSIPVYCTCLLE